MVISVTETACYNASEKCDNEQISVAKEKLKEKFNREIHIHIINQCLDNANYQFNLDPRYSNHNK